MNNLHQFSEAVIALRQNQAKQTDLIDQTLDLLDQLSQSYIKMERSLETYANEVKGYEND